MNYSKTLIYTNKFLKHAHDFSGLAEEKVSIEQLIREGPKNMEEVKQLKADFLDAAKHVVNSIDEDQQKTYINILIDLTGPIRKIFAVK